MKIFETLEEYKKHAQINDRIVLGGKGLMDGIKTLETKNDTFKVYYIRKDGQIVIKSYRGKKPLIVGAYAYDQQVALLTKKEFKNLPVI